MSHVPHIVIMTVDTIVLIVLTVNTGWCIISYESTHLPLIESKGQRIKQRYTTKSLLFRKWVGFYDMDARNAALEQLFNVENSAHLERERTGESRVDYVGVCLLPRAHTRTTKSTKFSHENEVFPVWYYVTLHRVL